MRKDDVVRCDAKVGPAVLGQTERQARISCRPDYTRKQPQEMRFGRVP